MLSHSNFASHPKEIKKKLRKIRSTENLEGTKGTF